jgi:hypothetical protein
MQTPLAEAAALATAWQLYPESAPFHGLSIHVATCSGMAGAPRVKVISALVLHLGGLVSAAQACDVCVLCNKLAGKGSNSAQKAGRATADQPRCKRGAIFVADSWVVEAVQAASRPEYVDHVV